MAPAPLPRPPDAKEEKAAAAEKARTEKLEAIVKAAKHLAAGWQASGFYDRQDPAAALSLQEALDA